MKRRRISPEDTRRRLILAGTHLFGMKGVAATRTRELASMAGVNQAAIPYYFDGKEGLYLAVAEHIVTLGSDQLADRTKSIVRKIQAGPLDKPEAGRLLIEFFHGFLDNVVLSKDLSDRARFIMREYTTPGAGFDIIYRGLLEKNHKLMCLLVAAILDADPESEDVMLRTGVIFGMVISNVLVRRFLFRRLEWDGFTPDRVERLKKIITESVCRGLNLGDPLHLMESS